LEYKISVHTDIGTRKETNQDSCCVKEAKTDQGTILFAILCDGMGGLAKGEVASATLIKRFENWFENELPHTLSEKDVIGKIKLTWDRIIKEQNQEIASYGNTLKIQLGTTVTALLILENNDYIVVHVGDSRLYRITDSEIEVLTEDQTLVANEVKLGRLTPEQAETDPRRNVLLQCVGASRIVEPAFVMGKAFSDECYMLCSDGFRHVVTSNEILTKFAPSNNADEDAMKNNIIELVELNKTRGETDNISAILVKAI
jgi:serine/threonine protein phosphatase PrpC